jgi:hypothetical protein
MSYYIKRTRIVDGRIGWTGPIRSARQAERERAAWASEGPYKDDCPMEGFTAEMYESTPEIKREVRAWQRERNIAHGRV